MIRRSWLCMVMGVLSFSISGCTEPSTANSEPVAEPAPSTVFFSMTHNGQDDPQRLDMGLKLAGFSLDEGRKVVMFFNVKGVEVPTQDYDDELAYAENEPIATQLAGLIERGADVHVCPICMKALDVEEGDLIDGAKVTTRPSLFANIGPDTAVFTY